MAEATVNQTTWVALFAYDGRINNTMPFLKGDQFILVNGIPDNVEWWVVNKLGTIEETGRVPSNYLAKVGSLEMEEWFHIDVSRQEAEKVLRNHVNRGSYFVTYKEEFIQDESKAVLSVKEHKRKKRNGRIGHYIINSLLLDGCRQYYLYDDQKSYASISQLLEELKKPKCEIYTKLTGFLPKSLPELPFEQAAHAEMDLDLFQNITNISEGNFSSIYKATLKDNIQRFVAMKILKDCKETEDTFKADVAVLAKLNHRHIIHVYGHLLKDQIVVLEFMSQTLLDLLRTNDMGTNFGLKMALQIADGMYYLATSNIVHGHLAARNTFLTSDGLEVKISDYGIINGNCFKGPNQRDNYLKWTAVEVFSDHPHTVKSDVWAFGMVLYEITTKGNEPFSDISNHDQLKRAIQDGTRPEKPSQCSDYVYEIMQNCWQKMPLFRPTFQTMMNDLRGIISKDVHYSAKFEPPPLPAEHPSTGPTSLSTDLPAEHPSTGPTSLSTCEDGYASLPGDVRIARLHKDGKIYSNGSFPVSCVASFDFEARDDTEISFEVDDDLRILEIISNEEGWLLAEHIATKKRGLVPSNYVALSDEDPYRCVPTESNNERTDQHSPSPSTDEDPYCFVPTKSNNERTDQQSSLFSEKYPVYHPLGQTTNRNMPPLPELETVNIGVFDKTSIDSDKLDKWPQEIRSLIHDNILTAQEMNIKESTIHFSMKVHQSATNLLTLLKNRSCSLSQLWKFSAQIVNGMAYLEEHEFRHGDLKAANIWVYPNDQIKIGRVGVLTLLKSTECCWPWTPPETIQYKVIVKSKYDIWSFGILLAEIASKGHLPESRHHETRDRNFFEKQDIWPEEIYKIICSCLQNIPDHRPSFTELKQQLYEYISKFFAEPEYETEMEIEIKRLGHRVNELEEKVKRIMEILRKDSAEPETSSLHDD